jgi:Transcriptional regulators
MAPTKRASQADIAEQLGVSVSTVSRALANEIGISDAVRRDVQRVARMLGYKSKHPPVTGAIDKRALALVPLGSATSGLSGFYFGILEGMRNEAANIGMSLDVRLVNEQGVTLELIQRQLAQADAQGVLLAGIDPWEELVAWSEADQVPIVLVNGSDPQMRLSAVSPANFYGAYMATKRLIDAGHRKILHYGQKTRPTLLQRLRGFRTAIADHPAVQGSVVYNAEVPVAQLVEDIRAGRHDITAIFSWNDIAAVELLEHFYGGGSGVSENFSIIGFDDLPIAGMASPRLSTMHVDRHAIGHVAIRVLRQHLDGDMAVQQVQIGLSAVEGETVFTLPASQ